MKRPPSGELAMVLDERSLFYDIAIAHSMLSVLTTIFSIQQRIYRCWIYFHLHSFRRRYMTFLCGHFHFRTMTACVKYSAMYCPFHQLIHGTTIYALVGVWDLRARFAILFYDTNWATRYICSRFQIYLVCWATLVFKDIQAMTQADSR